MKKKFEFFSNFFQKDIDVKVPENCFKILLCKGNISTSIKLTQNQYYIVSNTCHPAPCYLNSDKVFLLLSNRYRNPKLGFEPWTYLYLNLKHDDLDRSATVAGLLDSLYAAKNSYKKKSFAGLQFLI